MERILEILQVIEKLEIEYLHRPYLPRLVILPDGNVQLFWKDYNDNKRLYRGSEITFGNVSDLNTVIENLEKAVFEWYEQKVS